MATTIASDVSESTTAAIMENLDTLQGVNIEEDSIRYYPDIISCFCLFPQTCALPIFIDLVKQTHAVSKLQKAQ